MEVDMEHGGDVVEPWRQTMIQDVYELTGFVSTEKEALRKIVLAARHSLFQRWHAVSTDLAGGFVQKERFV
jgi:hypothetical protein